jgi:hypothetical protein
VGYGLEAQMCGTVADILVGGLEQIGVSHIFGVIGGPAQAAIVSWWQNSGKRSTSVLRYPERSTWKVVRKAMQ